MKIRAWFLASFIAFVGCQAHSQPSDERNDAIDQPQKSGIDKSGPELSERDIDIIRHVLQREGEIPADRIYFLTLTPMDEWGEDGKWNDVPQQLRAAIPSIVNKYGVAHDAYLRDGRVLERGTDREAWMKWITVKRWISETEVEVEDGIWCCPLGGGASTVTYEKAHGEWSIKSLGPSWAS